MLTRMANRREYDGLMLDHDLDAHFRGPQGKAVVPYVIERVENDVPIFVHSANVTGGPEMAHRLRTAGFDVTQVPMGQVTLERLRLWLEDVRRARSEYDGE